MIVDTIIFWVGADKWRSLFRCSHINELLNDIHCFDRITCDWYHTKHGHILVCDAHCSGILAAVTSNMMRAFSWVISLVWTCVGDRKDWWLVPDTLLPACMIAAHSEVSRSAGLTTNLLVTLTVSSHQGEKLSRKFQILFMLSGNMKWTGRETQAV